MNELKRLSIHTVTTKPWPVEKCIEEYAAAGVGGITLWRYNLEGRKPAQVGQWIRDAGLQCTGLARGGFFASADPERRKAAVRENLLAIEEAQACGAPVLVLVCGADPRQSLAASRGQIMEGIAACLEHAGAAGVRLALEPLHPMYADDRSALVTMAQANALCRELGFPPELGIAMDVYHTWWDPDLQREIEAAGKNGSLFAWHICDWRTPTRDLLNDRGLMGEGCIPLRKIGRWMRDAGFEGMEECEIFSAERWAGDQHHWLREVTRAWLQHCRPTPDQPNTL